MSLFTCYRVRYYRKLPITGASAVLFGTFSVSYRFFFNQSTLIKEQAITCVFRRPQRNSAYVLRSKPRSCSLFQLQSLRILEAENQEAAERLENVVRRGQDLLEQIQGALSDIAQAQLDMQHLTRTVTKEVV